MREILVVCTDQDFLVSRVGVERKRVETPAADRPPTVTIALEVQGLRSVAELAARLAETDGVLTVKAGDVNVPVD